MREGQEETGRGVGKKEEREVGGGGKGRKRQKEGSKASG